jgi:hypothetical protein
MLLDMFKELSLLFNTWLLKLWYTYHYWYASHCLLVRGLDKKSLNIKKIKFLKKWNISLIYMLITQRYYQRFMSHPLCQPVFLLSAIFKTKNYWWYINVVRFIWWYASGKIWEPYVKQIVPLKILLVNCIYIGLYNDAFDSSDILRRLIGRLVINELEKMWKEVALT